jgi:hypothetical protein
LSQDREVSVELLFEALHYKWCCGLCDVNVIFIQEDTSTFFQHLRYLYELFYSDFSLNKKGATCKKLVIVE